MKEAIKVGEKWVYIKCISCGRKKDFAKDAFDKKRGDKNPEEFAKTFVCKSCQSPKQDPNSKASKKINSEKEFDGPLTKDKQLRKKSKKVLSIPETDIDEMLESK